jgi:ferredoxin
MSTPESKFAEAAAAFPETSPNGRARRAALEGKGAAERRATSLVPFASAGRVAVIGHPADALPAAERLAEMLECTAVLTAEAAAPPGDVQPSGAETKAGKVRTIEARVSDVRGHLGAFEIDVTADGETRPLAPSLLTAHRPFDIVLDLGATPFVRAEVKPPGYFAPQREADALESALEQIPDLIGEFEKPRYFHYDAGICAHGRSGIIGCTRCLDACPTDAIKSLKDLIEVDPYLCQGAGTCATACPTGAITYVYPNVPDLLTELRHMLAAYREAGGSAPCVLFHDGEAGRDWLEANAGRLPENLIPFELEEIGSVGMDTWLAAIAYGVRQVVLLCPQAVPQSVRAETAHQLEIARRILEGMGYAQTLIACVDPEDEGWMSAVPASEDSDFAAAAFAGVAEKRTTLRLAVDHLHAQATSAKPAIDLPARSPFGRIHVDPRACTLCMACVSVCPASALADGGDQPKLKFIEWNCVQCGLCETACPEDAITLAPRFLFDSQARQSSRVLNEDEPFHCISCGKAFATTRVIERMHEKLAGHWMFQKPEAARRLEMCEDCRVKDMLEDGGGLLDVRDEP